LFIKKSSLYKKKNIQDNNKAKKFETNTPKKPKNLKKIKDKTAIKK
jgi:hypothetical protein